jgi:hypothetical protein
LQDDLVAEVLSYLPISDPLLNGEGGLRFFSNRDLVFRIKLRDIFNIDWKQCQKLFGANNLCQISLAYKNLKLEFMTNAFCGIDVSKLEKILEHPFVPACVLSQLPSESTQLKFVAAAWSGVSKTTELSEADCRYGIRLSCRCGNVQLVQSLVEYGRAKFTYMSPAKDDLYLVIRAQFLPMVKYILDIKNDFGITACAYCFDLVVATNNPHIFAYMLSTLPVEYRAEVTKRVLLSAKIKSADKIVAYLCQTYEDKVDNINKY